MRATKFYNNNDWGSLSMGEFTDGELSKDPSTLKHHPALVLNADYRPLSYYPLSLWCWQDAVKAAYMERVDIVAQYDKFVHSPTIKIKIPSVVVLKDYVKPQKSVAFTRFNLFLRDGFRCQYCGNRGELTFDHVIPRSLGGKTTWDNVVTSCRRCNTFKGNKLVNKTNLKLNKKPYTPNNYELKEIGKLFPPNFLHKSWNDFLYWDSELEP